MESLTLWHRSKSDPNPNLWAAYYYDLSFSAGCRFGRYSGVPITLLQFIQLPHDSWHPSQTP